MSDPASVLVFRRLLERLSRLKDYLIVLPCSCPLHDPMSTHSVRSNLDIEVLSASMPDRDYLLLDKIVIILQALAARCLLGICMMIHCVKLLSNVLLSIMTL